jgi:hypothetical protein
LEPLLKIIVFVVAPMIMTKTVFGTNSILKMHLLHMPSIINKIACVKEKETECMMKIVKISKISKIV